MQAMWGALHPRYALTEIPTHLCSRNRGIVTTFLYIFIYSESQKFLAADETILILAYHFWVL